MKNGLDSSRAAASPGSSPSESQYRSVLPPRAQCEALGHITASEDMLEPFDTALNASQPFVCWSASDEADLFGSPLVEESRDRTKQTGSLTAERFYSFVSSVSRRKLDTKPKPHSDLEKKQSTKNGKEKSDEQRGRKGSAGDLGQDKHPEEPPNQPPPCEIRREKHKEERKKRSAVEDTEVNHVTQSEQHKWEQKRERMSEELKKRRHGEEDKNEGRPEELKDESRPERLTPTQPGEGPPGDPQRKKQADPHKPLFER